MQILYRVEAERDVAKAQKWYDQQRAGLGRDFLAVMRRAEELLADHPEAFQTAHGDYRRMVLLRFPYAVYYRPLDDGRLEIVAVLHQRQDADVLDNRE